MSRTRTPRRHPTTAGNYQQCGIDGSGEGAGLEAEELRDVESVYTPYDQFASNDHLPAHVDTPYGADTAYPSGHGAGDTHTPERAQGPGPFTQISRSVETPIHQSQQTSLVQIQAPNRAYTRALALQLPGANAGLYVSQKALNVDQRRQRAVLTVGSGADKPVWISHEVISPSNVPGPYAFPIIAGEQIEIHTTQEIWAIADPGAAAVPQLYVLEETRR